MLLAFVLGLVLLAMAPLPFVGTSTLGLTPLAKLVAGSGRPQASQPVTTMSTAEAMGAQAVREDGRRHRAHLALPRPTAPVAPSAAPAGPTPRTAQMAQPGPPAATPQVAAGTHNVDCTLAVPASPLTAQGLATPWRLSAADTGACHEANPNSAAFVQAVILDPQSGQVFVYEPLVVDVRTRPAMPITVPTLPGGATVGIFVSFNGNNLTLTGPGSAACVTGAANSPFGQVAFCNALVLFTAANQAITAGKLKPPALATARDGKPCPTTRDFSAVDQDPSGSVTTTYLATADGAMAQNTPQNAARLKKAQAEVNGSDDGLLDRALATALGCAWWTVPDLTDPTRKTQSMAWALNELMAAVRQPAPAALVPAMDPAVIIGSGPNLEKGDAYRGGVDQPQVTSLAQADTKAYCQNLLAAGLPRINGDRALTAATASPFPAEANSLFTFLAMRFNQTFSNGSGFLQCQTLLNVVNPVTLQVTNGVVTGATINLRPGPMPRPPAAKPVAAAAVAGAANKPA